MKIQYASDLHLEFSMNSKFMKMQGLEPVGDILLLAGDIIYLENRLMEQSHFFNWCSQNFKETIIVPGNHEYYIDLDANPNKRKYVNLADTLVGYERKIRDNVRYLNNKSIVLGDIEIFPTTLWTVTDPRFYVGIQTGMNDCHLITYQDHRLWADDYAEVHNICTDWLDTALRESKAKTKIVLSHHCPTERKEFDTHQAGSGLWSAFHVDMEPFIAGHEIDYWIYGHTHVNSGSGTVVESASGGATLLCNQLGYVALDEETSGFNSKAVIEI